MSEELDHQELLAVLDLYGLHAALRAIDERDPGGLIARNFAAECAEDALEIFECKFPKEPAPRRAIEVARDENATPEERAKAAEAARDAARLSKKYKLISFSLAINDAAWSAAFAAEGFAESAAESSASAILWADKSASRAGIWNAQALKLRKLLKEVF